MDKVLILIWAASGVLPLLRWKFSEREVTMLDLVACCFVGTVLGSIIPLLQLLHSIKLKGGQHGAD